METETIVGLFTKGKLKESTKLVQELSLIHI